jgi:predicted DNA-binding protein
MLRARSHEAPHRAMALPTWVPRHGYRSAWSSRIQPQRATDPPQARSRLLSMRLCPIVMLMREPVHFRFPPELNAALTARSRELGQTRTEYVMRALEKALSEANGAIDSMRAGPAPVLSREGVRPAAPSQASVKRHRPTCSCQICRPKRSEP